MFRPPIEMRSKEKLHLLLRAFQRRIIHHLTNGSLVDSRFFVVGSQTANFDSRPFFLP